MEVKIAGYQFNDCNLFQQALTHPSVDKQPNYQRLEYLGDSILGMIIAEYLYKSYPHYSDGQLSVIKNELVKRDTLNFLGQEIGIPALIHFGKGEIAKTGPQNHSIIEDVFEAVIGAIYLDSSFEVIQKWILAIFEGNVSELFDYQFAVNRSNNPIQKLQMLTQKLYKKTPAYTVIGKTGEDHMPVFTISATIEEFSATGKGKNKQQGMEVAARELLLQIENLPTKSK